MKKTRRRTRKTKPKHRGLKIASYAASGLLVGTSVFLVGTHAGRKFSKMTAIKAVLAAKKHRGRLSRALAKARGSIKLRKVKSKGYIN